MDCIFLTTARQGGREDSQTGTMIKQCGRDRCWARLRTICYSTVELKSEFISSEGEELLVHKNAMQPCICSNCPHS